MKLFRLIKYFLIKLKFNIKNQQVLSPDVNEELENIDWSIKDVLVGTVRTYEQFNFNINNLCYYAPSKFIAASHFPINYIALYEGDLKNCNGVRYYGKITDISKLRRCEIPVLSNKNNENELYYFFKVEKWNSLKKPLEVKDTVGGQPKFTNMFLLKNCFSTYQLYHINSPSQFKLMYNIETKNRNLYRINQTYSILIKKGEIILLNNITNTQEKIKLLEYKEKPLEVYLNLKRKIFKQPS